MIKQIPPQQMPEEIEAAIPKLETSDDDTITLLNAAIEKLWQEDSWLLISELNERCIAHKLAIHIAELFPDYQVDCEYNGNIQHPDQDKIVGMWRNEIEAIGANLNENEIKTNEEILMRRVNPDIIIHSRKTNRNNLCVIELKTRYTRPVEVDFDDLKLKAYTKPLDNHGLGYQLGFYLSFRRYVDGLHINKTKYQNGVVVPPDEAAAVAVVEPAEE